MKVLGITLLVAAQILALVGLGDATAFAQAMIPVEGTVREGGSFTGRFILQRFAAADEGMLAIGRVEGTLLGTRLGDGRLRQPLQRPVNIVQATCQILRLDLAAFNLDILGVNARLSAISIVVDGQSGPGRLVGHILCAIANLPTANVPEIVNLLNQMLSLSPGAFQVRNPAGRPPI